MPKIGPEGFVVVVQWGWCGAAVGLRAATEPGSAWETWGCCKGVGGEGQRITVAVPVQRHAGTPQFGDAEPSIFCLLTVLVDLSCSRELSGSPEQPPCAASMFCYPGGNFCRGCEQAV